MPNCQVCQVCQVASLRRKHSLWMFGQLSFRLKSHGFLSITTGANVDMRKSSSANSRNPADLHIIQQPFEIFLSTNAQPPKRHKGGWIDVGFTMETMETMFVGFRLQNRCFQYSLRCKSASERHLGDLCKNLGPLRCNRQICIVVNVRDGSL